MFHLAYPCHYPAADVTRAFKPLHCPAARDYTDLPTARLNFVVQREKTQAVTREDRIYCVQNLRCKVWAVCDVYMVIHLHVFTLKHLIWLNQKEVWSNLLASCHLIGQNVFSRPRKFKSPECWSATEVFTFSSETLYKKNITGRLRVCLVEHSESPDPDGKWVVLNQTEPSLKMQYVQSLS